MLNNQLTPIGAAAIQSREGVKLVGYLDSVDVPTVGWGHTGPEVFVGMKITRAQAIAYFNQDAAKHSKPVNQYVKVGLSDNQYDALCSFAFNVGVTAFKRSTLLKKLNKGDYAGAAAEFDNWHKPVEVTSRRNAEKEQFLTPYSVALPKARSSDKSRIKQPVSAPIPVAAPAPSTASPATPAKSSVGGLLASLWAKLHPPAAAAPSAPVTKGDPVVYSVQSQLKARGYYLNGLLDGIDGPKTRDAVAASRKDNGLGDGGIDADYLAKLPTFGKRPVSELRTKTTTQQAYQLAKQQAPELAQPVGFMWKAGLSLLGLGGAGAANDGGLLDSIKSAGDQANDALGTVNAAFATVAQIVQFCVTHWKWIAVAVGLYLILRAASYALNFIIKFRQAFF